MYDSLKKFILIIALLNTFSLAFYFCFNGWWWPSAYSYWLDVFYGQTNILPIFMWTIGSLLFCLLCYVCYSEFKQSLKLQITFFVFCLLNIILFILAYFFGDFSQNFISFEVPWYLVHLKILGFIGKIILMAPAYIFSALLICLIALIVFIFWPALLLSATIGLAFVFNKIWANLKLNYTKTHKPSLKKTALIT